MGHSPVSLVQHQPLHSPSLVGSHRNVSLTVARDETATLPRQFNAKADNVDNFDNADMPPLTRRNAMVDVSNQAKASTPVLAANRGPTLKRPPTRRRRSVLDAVKMIQVLPSPLCSLVQSVVVPCLLLSPLVSSP